MKTKYKYIHFVEMHSQWRCLTNRTKDLLGFIEWNEKWKKEEYVPLEGTGYTIECLHDIADFMKQLEEERNENHRKT